MLDLLTINFSIFSTFSLVLKHIRRVFIISPKKSQNFNFFSTFLFQFVQTSQLLYRLEIYPISQFIQLLHSFPPLRFQQSFRAEYLNLEIRDFDRFSSPHFRYLFTNLRSSQNRSLFLAFFLFVSNVIMLFLIAFTVA